MFTSAHYQPCVRVCVCVLWSLFGTYMRAQMWGTLKCCAHGPCGAPGCGRICVCVYVCICTRFILCCGLWSSGLRAYLIAFSVSKCNARTARANWRVCVCVCVAAVAIFAGNGGAVRWWRAHAHETIRAGGGVMQCVICVCGRARMDICNTHAVYVRALGYLLCTTNTPTENDA